MMTFDWLMNRENKIIHTHEKVKKKVQRKDEL